MTLRLGLYRLPNAEVVLIQTLLRLYSGKDNQARWAIADIPPFDAVLVDDTGGNSAIAEAHRLTQAVLRISRIGSKGGPDTIQRPIRSDQLFQWLNGRSSRQALSPHRIGAAATTVVAEAETTPSDTETEPAVRYQLKRWPPTVVLRNDARRVYLATLLLKRALSISDIAAMSRQPFEDCHAFVRLLRATGLVNAVGADGLPLTGSESGPMTLPQAIPQPAPKRSIARGLIGQLRRKLGL